MRINKTPIGNCLNLQPKFIEKHGDFKVEKQILYKRPEHIQMQMQ